MTGEGLEMNKAIDTDKGRPQLINRDPLGKGWILKMKATGKNLYLPPTHLVPTQNIIYFSTLGIGRTFYRRGI